MRQRGEELETLDLAALVDAVTVINRRADGNVTIEIPGNATNKPMLLPYADWRRWLEQIFRRPFRPVNEDTEYNRPVYSSGAPIVLD